MQFCNVICNGRGKTILAPCVVSAAGVLCTYTRLIPSTVRVQYANYIIVYQHLKPSIYPTYFTYCAQITSAYADEVRSHITPTHTHARKGEDVGLIGL